jgi:hypothetical protein
MNAAARLTAEPPSSNVTYLPSLPGIASFTMPQHRIRILVDDVELDPNQPVHVLKSVTDQDDETTVHMGDREHFVLRQVDEEGTAHVVTLSRDMVAEVARMFNAYLVIK